MHAITVGRAMGMCVNTLVAHEYLDEALDTRFAQQVAKFELRFSKTERDTQVLKWLPAFLKVAAVSPEPEKLVV